MWARDFLLRQSYSQNHGWTAFDPPIKIFSKYLACKNTSRRIYTLMELTLSPSYAFLLLELAEAQETSPEKLLADLISSAFDALPSQEIQQPESLSALRRQTRP